MKAHLLAANPVKEMDFSRAKRVRAEQLEEDSLVALLVRLGMASEHAMAEAVAEVIELPMVKPAQFLEEPLLKERFSGCSLKD
ncbi:MAG: hypothetical protein R3E57_08170 [Porticoccaceae bacterium]